MENEAMTSTISKLAEVDPVFREVISKLYPALDVREAWDLAKSMPDGSSVHVNQNVNSERRKKVALGAGLLVGATAEGMGTAETGAKAIRLVRDSRPAMSAAKGFGGKFKALGGKGKIASTAFQAGNMAVGLAAAKTLIKPKRQVEETTLTKADFDPILIARRNGVISTEKALELIAEVEKGFVKGAAGTAKWAAADMPKAFAQGSQKAAQGMIFRPMKKMGKNASDTINSVRGIHETMDMAGWMGDKGTQAAYGEHLTNGVNQAINQGRALTGAVVAGGVYGAGHHHGKKKAEKQLTAGPVIKNDSDYEFTGEISKFDNAKRQVFGWCSLSTVDGQPVVDLQNDYISIEEIEKAAYAYVKSSRKGGDMHARVGEEPLHTSDMIESMIVTPDKLKSMGLSDEAIAKSNTGWWVGFQINDQEQWRKVQTGERTGFSIHGKGARVEKVLNA